jgi:hypothetical protein
MIKKENVEGETNEVPMLGGQIAARWKIPGGVPGGPGMLVVGVNGALNGGKSKKLHVIVTEASAPPPSDDTLRAAPDYLSGHNREVARFYQEMSFPIVVGKSYIVSALIEWNTPLKSDRLANISGKTYS